MDKKTIINTYPNTEMDEKTIADMIDSMMENGTGRLKIVGSEDMQPGEILKQYHHGRCDIGSPYACGTPVDVIE